MVVKCPKMPRFHDHSLPLGGVGAALLTVVGQIDRSVDHTVMSRRTSGMGSTPIPGPVGTGS